MREMTTERLRKLNFHQYSFYQVGDYWTTTNKNQRCCYFTLYQAVISDMNNLNLLSISSDHIYAEMTARNSECTTCHSSTSHFMYLCSYCDNRSCCACVYSRGYCTCDRPYGSTTIVLENLFFSKFDKHVCKLEPLSTQYLTSSTRTELTESGCYRTEQTFTKSLVDHLHRNRMDARQAQYIVNKLAELTHIYGSKISKSFNHLNINSSTLIENITKVDRTCEPLAEDQFQGGQRLFTMYYNSCLKAKPKPRGHNKNIIVLISLTCLFSVILSLFLSAIPVVKATNDADQPIQIKLTILYERFKINVNNNIPHGTVTRFTQTTVKWALQEFISITDGRIEPNPNRHKVSFCNHEIINIKHITSQLKVGPVQNSIISRNSSNYYLNCFSSFKFQHEKLIDIAIMSNLRKFSQKYNRYNSIDPKMLLELNNTINLSLYAYQQKVKRIFFQPPLYGTCSTKICINEGDGVIIYELVQGSIEKNVKNARAFIWCFYVFTAMVSSVTFLFIIFLHL